MNLRQNQRYSIKIQRNKTAGKTAILFFLCESEWNEMKKTSITISYDEEKLSALKLYLGQKNSSAENELAKALDKQPSALFRNVSGEFPRARNGRLSGRTAGSKSIAGERRTSKFDARQIHQPAVRAERRSEVASKQRIPGLSDIKILENCLCTGK